MGMSVEETAEVLGVSDKTVMREWESAKLWLYRELDAAGAPAVGGRRSLT
jgi:DNA-directed RNA polymerase specialized sigma24 family protein